MPGRAAPVREPHLIECRTLDGCVALAEDGHQFSAHLTVGSGELLHPPGRAVVGRTTGLHPGAFGERTPIALRVACGAHRRAEFHQRGENVAARERVRGSRTSTSARSSGGRVPGFGLTVDSARDDAPHIGVDHGNTLTIRKTCDCSGRVRPDPRQRQQDVDVVGDPVVVLGGEDPRALVQAQCPTRIPELAPRPQHLGLTRRGHRRRDRPPPDPLFPDGRDPHDRSLLQHDLRHQDLPARHTFVAPRKIPCFGGVPTQHHGRIDRHLISFCSNTRCCSPGRNISA